LTLRGVPVLSSTVHGQALHEGYVPLSAVVHAGGASAGSGGSAPGAWQVASTIAEPVVVLSTPFDDSVEPLMKNWRTRVEVVLTRWLPETCTQLVAV
jgi:hypothetical protein